MSRRPAARLLLDEMFSPAIAAELRDRGHDVIAVADRPDLRAKSDEEIFAWSSAERRWLLTENVKDFRPIMLRALPGGPPGCGLLFTSLSFRARLTSAVISAGRGLFPGCLSL